MLVLTRRPGERVLVGDDTYIELLDIYRRKNPDEVSCITVRVHYVGVAPVTDVINFGTSKSFGVIAHGEQHSVDIRLVNFAKFDRVVIGFDALPRVSITREELLEDQS